MHNIWYLYKFPIHTSLYFFTGVECDPQIIAKSNATSGIKGRFGDSAVVQCDEDHFVVMDGPDTDSMTVACLEDGTWNMKITCASKTSLSAKFRFY